MQASATSLSGSAAVADARSLDALRSSAARDPQAAIKEAAKQFEALFMQQLMKSMRDSTLSSGMLDNAGTQMGTEMLDTQFATKMTGLPGGLSEVIARQLERQMGGSAAPRIEGLAGALSNVRPAAVGVDGDGGTTGAAAVPGAAAADLPVSQRQTDFLRVHQSSARAAEALTGIPATFMVAQAAHETGWGRHEIRNADGSSSHNLFGIKAGAGWNGAVAEIITTEYVGGEAQKVSAKFRSYASYEDAFRDYARLLKDSPRYAGVVAQAAANPASPQGFAQGLQRAGYATDPAYADKLTRVINTALRLQRVVG